MDKLFDCLNSKRFRADKMFNSALHKINPIVENTLQKATECFETLQKQDFAGKISRPPCFDGMIQTINGILLFYKNEQKNNPDIYVLTTKFSQDALEHLFGKIRQKGGSNVNPTARSFRTLFRSVTVNCLIKPPESSNYEDSAMEPDLLLENKERVEELRQEENETEIQQSSSTSGSPMEIIESSSDSADSDKENLENAAIKYFSGYLAHFTLKKFNCSNCKERLLSPNIFFTDKNDQLIFNRMYESVIKVTELQGLKKPSQELYNVVKCAVQLFDIHIDNCFNEEQIRNKIFKSLLKYSKKIRKFCEGVCSEHNKFLLNHLINIKIFKYCKNSVSNKKSFKRKLNILQSV